MFRKTADQRIAALQDRVEGLEAAADRPKATSGTGAPGADHKTYRTSHGTVYDLPSTTSMQDVLPPEKRPEISLDRWLAATVAGEKCGDV